MDLQEDLGMIKHLVYAQTALVLLASMGGARWTCALGSLLIAFLMVSGLEYTCTDIRKREREQDHERDLHRRQREQIERERQQLERNRERELQLPRSLSRPGGRAARSYNRPPGYHDDEDIPDPAEDPLVYRQRFPPILPTSRQSSRVPRPAAVKD